MDRRTFLKTCGAAAAGAVVLGAPKAGTDAGGPTDAKWDHAFINAKIAATAKGKMPTRILGRMGVEVSVLGLGAAFVQDAKGEDPIALINRIIDSGINYLDTASQYGNGNSEKLLGQVMKTRRAEVFLATKTHARSYEQSKLEFEGPLERLQTDHVDLLQIHAVNSKRELEQVFSSNGSLQAALEAQRKGLTRFIGITGHTRPAVLSEAIRRHDFDSILMPLGIADQFLNDFSPVIAEAKARDMSVVGMKLLGAGGYVKEVGVERCLRYTMNLPIAVGIVGMKSQAELEQALGAMKNLTPLNATELAESSELARKFANTNTLWWKKT